MFSLSKNIIKQALDLSPVATVIVDLKSRNQPVMYVNQAFEALSGFDASELLGRPWHQLVTSTVESSHEHSGLAELRCHPRLGASEHLQLDLLPLYDRPGEPRYWVATEQQQVPGQFEQADRERESLLAVLRDARMHLRRLDGRDSATGVLNQRAFRDLLQRDWVMARREQSSVALLVFQLDSFPGYRDVFGRHSADACLRKVAHSITGSMRRAGDLTARLSDDQFVVLMGQADLVQARELASQIASRVRGLAIHHPRSTQDRFVTVSSGCASIVPESAQASDELLRAALDDLDQGSGAVAPTLHATV